ncbi:hypothetical protein HJFPF1_02682 [Paramyrothecium foliicola]|nr:hypothetical protein HJFPF1_02682 [Paramyrothecium foliicola]
MPWAKVRGDYIALPGLGTGVIIAGYFGWKYANGDFKGRERGGIIAAIVVGAGLVISMGLWAYLAWCQRMAMARSDRSTTWWRNLWSRKRQSQAVREMLDIKQEPREASDSRIHQLNERHQRNLSRSGNRSARNSIHDTDVERGAGGNGYLEEPAEAHVRRSNDVARRDPNPNSLLNV